MIVARDIHLWDKDPVRTEAECYFSLLPVMDTSTDALYVAYPWAACLNGLRSLQPPLVPLGFGSDIFTVCQHIRFRELIPLFKTMGIKILFTPHALESEPEISEVQIKGFPHWPANFSMSHGSAFDGFLFSFVGAVNSGVRRRIVAELSGCEKGFVKARHHWHFDNSDGSVAARKAEYREVIAKSIFVLCPRGTGPSSLRIFEALAAGRIPIILADDLHLPAGIPWEKCSLRFLESEVDAIPSKLSQIDPDVVLEMTNAARQAGQRLISDFAFPIKEGLASGGFKVWMTSGERQFVESFLSPHHTMLEWGAGGSTVAFSKLVSIYVSIEHDPVWFNMIQQRLSSTNLYLIETPHGNGPGCPVAFDEYIRFPSKLGLRFDRVLIDGRCRVACAREIVKSGMLSKEGLVFIHDWNRGRYHEVLDWFDIVAEIRSPEPDQRGIVALRIKDSFLLKRHRKIQMSCPKIMPNNPADRCGRRQNDSGESKQKD